MGLVQRIILAFVSRERGRAMEEESRSWLVRCPKCEHERSIWELGGIRYGASGNPQYRARCPACGVKGSLLVYKRGEPVPSAD